MANININKVIQGGRLTAAPELKTTPNGTSVTSFTIAINRKSSKEEPGTDFINCVAWGDIAERISKYLHKGSAICVFGELQKRKYQNNKGENRYVTEVVVKEAHFIDSKNEINGAASYPTQPAPTVSDTEFEEITDDELPFK